MTRREMEQYPNYLITSICLRILNAKVVPKSSMDLTNNMRNLDIDDEQEI